MTALSSPVRIGISVLLVAIATPLFFITSDREFSNLTPTAGRVFSVPLRSASEYAQTVTAQRTSLTRLGLFFGGTTQHFPAGDVHIGVTTQSGQEQTSRISSRAIDNEGSTQVKFDPPLTTRPGEQIIMTIKVDRALDNVMTVQMRDADGSYDRTSALFTVDGTAQELPLAYQLYYAYRPPLALQLAGILLMAALLLHLPYRAWGWAIPVLYAPVNSALAVVPALSLGHIPWLLFFCQWVALSGMYIYLRRHVTIIPALFGAHTFAFTTWFALHILAGRSEYALLALLPWIALGWEKFFKSQQWQGAVVSTIFVLVLLFVGSVFSHQTPLSENAGASWQDIFFDPNQVPSSQKVSADIGWEHFGSYLGFINAALVAIGLLINIHRQRKLFITSLIVLALISQPLISYAAPFSLVPLSHLVILLTFLLAVWTGLGVTNLQNFLGPKDRFVVGILVAFLLIALFDLWHVLAGTLEYTFLL